MKILKRCLILSFATGQIYAQGCSDAGICSIGKSFQEESNDFKNSFEINSIAGKGDGDVFVFTQNLSYTRKFNERFSINSRVTFNVADGDFGTRGQFGDAYLIGNYQFKEKANKKWSALLGWKFPFTSANAKINNVSLPMDYQASLGTFDLFIGSNLNFKAWDFNMAFQIPVFNINKNSYFDGFSDSDEYPSTNLFERKPDVLFRTIYTLKTNSQKWFFKPSLLFIYHLGEDSFENQFSNRETIEGSDGLTINGNLVGIYKFNAQNSLEASFATPFAVREVRPDGLTRSFVLGITYKILF